MLGLFAFLIVILGSINWLMIGLLQYDFVAGWFGYQGSIFSRLIYIFIGVCSFVLVFKAFKDRGKINLINFRKKEKRETEREEDFVKNPKYAMSNVESSREFDYKSPIENPSKSPQRSEISGKDYSEHDIQSTFEKDDSPQKNNLFDEIKN